VKLVLQCAVCGTVHAVGATVCGTCHATGVRNLRLMFECPRCFGLGITPACAACPPVLPLEPYEVVPDHEVQGGEVLVPEFLDEPGDAATALPVADEPDEFDFDFGIDEDEAGAAEAELRLDGLDIAVEEE
jgi:rubredoxin